MKKISKSKLVLCIVILGAVCVLGKVNRAEAASKSGLQNKVKELTNDKIKKVYYADYDYDGKKEAFIITEQSSDQQSIWFASDKETKQLTGLWIIQAGQGQGICKVGSKQKLFIAEGSAGGSGSWSYCYYVKKGKVYKVKKSGEELFHISGKNFAVFPSAFDYNFNVVWTGHTWKQYYIKWTGTKFVQYVGMKISQAKLKKYSGGNKYLKQIRKAGYKIGKIYYRKNGIININVYKQVSAYGGIDYNNVTLRIKQKKVDLVVIRPKGKDIVEKSGYGGIYKSKCNLWEARDD